MGGMGRFLLVRNSVFGRFWLARTISYLGSAVTTVALVLYVYEVEGSGVSVGLVLLAETLPRLLGPFAGAVVDRVDARRLMVLCDLGQAALIGSVALFLPPFPVLVALVAGASTLSTLFFPAGRGAVPALVAPEDLTPANALLGTSANVGFAGGPALGGVAVAVVGASGALLFDALTFLFSAALLLKLPSLPPAAREEAAPTRSFFQESLDGLLYVFRHGAVRAVASGLFLGVAFLALDGVALVFLARETFGAGDAAYGIFAAAHGVGMILGPLFLVRRRSPAGLSLVPIILLGLALEGLTTLSTGLAPFLALAITLRILGGVGNGVENVAVDTLLQKIVPRAMLGRVFGAVYGGAFLAVGLAYAAGGPLLEATSPRAVFVIAGAGTLATMLLVWRMLPRSAGGDSTL